MDKSELLKKIEDIIFALPDETYRLAKPKSCSEVEWQESSLREKAFLLVEHLLLESKRDVWERAQTEETNLVASDLYFVCPTFYSQTDENMFYNSIYTMPSYVKLVKQGRKLHLYNRNPMSKEEKKFLADLLKRYRVNTPKQLNL